jgi:hypothetical protein
MMPNAAAHCRIGRTTSLLATTQGDDVECCPVNIAVLLYRRLGLRFKRNWPDIPGFSAIGSVSELSGRRL